MAYPLDEPLTLATLEALHDGKYLTKLKLVIEINQNTHRNYSLKEIKDHVDLLIDNHFLLIEKQDLDGGVYIRYWKATHST